MFFFFKQKTAYEIKECDWSSDVCSSDLYITIVNTNEKKVRLYKGIHIARLFIFKLVESVNKSYIAGKYLKIDQQLAEIPVRKFWFEHELGNIEDEQILESIRNGCSIGDLLTQMISKQKQNFTINRYWLFSLTGILIAFIIWPTIVELLASIKPPDWLNKKIVEIVVTIVITIALEIGRASWRERV